MPIRRCARDKDGTIIVPMTLANMREHGVRSVVATCEKCQHEALVNVDDWPEETPVPDVRLKLRCSKCGGKSVDTRP